MNDFAYARASNVAAAAARLAASDTVLIAGGTELLNWIQLGIVEPQHIVDIGGLEGLDRIVVERGCLAIGALASLNTVGEHPLVVQHAGVLAQACLSASSAQIRNRATLGGNVLQKTRCAYFRTEPPLPWPCNKRQPGSGCAARGGLNERHAIFGWTDACVAVHPSDPAVALACLDARVDVVGTQGRRTIPMRWFHLSQQEAEADGHDPATRETRLKTDEVIVGYRIPLLAAMGSAYVKVRERDNHEYALISAAATVVRDGGVIKSARVALGSVAQRPWRLDDVEAQLVGQPLTHDAVMPLVDAALRNARPLAHNGYKVEMARDAAVQALLNAGG